MKKIDRQLYPELDRLLWDTKVRHLDGKEALEVYERRWPFVDLSRLTAQEKRLIDTLATQAGGFLPART